MALSDCRLVFVVVCRFWSGFGGGVSFLGWLVWWRAVPCCRGVLFIAWHVWWRAEPC
jgi:hypothetical protein